MAEATAVRRAEEPAKPIRYSSPLDQIEDTFNAVARRAYEIFEGNGRAFGRISRSGYRLSFATRSAERRQG